MRERLQRLIEVLKKKLAETNPIIIFTVPIVTALGTLMTVRSFELSDSRKEELKNSHFLHSSEIAQKIHTSTYELVTLLQNSSKNETIYHNNTLFVRTKNEVYRDDGVNEISRLKLANKGRFKAVDNLKNEYKADQFSLISFPQINAPIRWLYNSKSNSGLLIAPGRDEVTVTHVPMSWFHELLKAQLANSFSADSEASARETFEWAIIHEPPPETKTSAGDSPELQAETTDKKTTDANKTNLILANSDSLEFRQSLSEEFQNSKLLEGPARQLSIKDSLTEQAGFSVIPITGTNLRLVKKWTASWNFLDALLLFKTDFAILALLAGLFYAASWAYKIRFSRLSDQLITALVKLNPSKSIEPENSQERKLEKTFDAIFESAVWLYKLASQRQQKYSALSEYIKNSIFEEKYFLTYIRDQLQLSNFYVTHDSRSRWRLCLLRSPYIQEPTTEVFFAIAADSSLARIIMFSIFSAFLERTAAGLGVTETAKQISEKLSLHTGLLDIQVIWFIVNEEKIINQTIDSYPLGNSLPFDLNYEEGLARLTDPDGHNAITFALNNASAENLKKAEFSPVEESTMSLPRLSDGGVG
jgi:hypothetical protein